jgi:hypothetical protein
MKFNSAEKAYLKCYRKGIIDTFEYHDDITKKKLWKILKRTNPTDLTEDIDSKDSNKQILFDHALRQLVKKGKLEELAGNNSFILMIIVR